MNIALIAHDVRMELMVQFCIAYKGILSKHNLCATATTGKLVSDAAGFGRIVTFLSGDQGGYQQIASRISCGEIDMVVFFRDAAHPDKIGKAEEDILRLCDVHTVPYATNAATAESLIRGLERGDLDWRSLGNRPVI